MVCLYITTRKQSSCIRALYILVIPSKLNAKGISSSCITALYILVIPSKLNAKGTSSLTLNRRINIYIYIVEDVGIVIFCFVNNMLGKYIPLV